ncbi:DUF5676 family membrane protein [Myxosarcina sp. GI1]|uniref:DUF5676 family membrane protein n=1 Tax=Myxosarcina sp. GI1 TaxID=1541065 RepID=UPI00068CE73E|nr:DUF5676 family membrane protein [Myxosarcina sp. GI1]
MKSNIQPRNNHRISRFLVMKLNVRSLFIATAAITGVVYVICFLFILIAPQSTMAFFSYIIHIDLTNLPLLVNWGSFIVGILFWSLGTAFYTALIVWLYNRFLVKSKIRDV